MNKETKKIDFVSEVYDPKVLAYPYDANLFAVALPSMIDTTVAD